MFYIFFIFSKKNVIQSFKFFKKQGLRIFQKTFYDWYLRFRGRAMNKLTPYTRMSLEFLTTRKRQTCLPTLGFLTTRTSLSLARAFTTYQDRVVPVNPAAASKQCKSVVCICLSRTKSGLVGT